MVDDQRPNIGTVADPIRRGLARLVDAGIVLFATYLGGVAFGHWSPFSLIRPQDNGSTIGRVIALVVSLAVLVYEPIMIATRQQTIGKLLVGTKVRVDGGKPMSFGRAVRRHLPSLFVRLLAAIVLVLFLTASESGTEDSAARVIQNPDGTSVILPPDSDAFRDDVQKARGDALGGYIGMALLFVSGLNAGFLVATGRSFADKLGSTTVILDTDHPDPPLAPLLARIEERMP